MFSISKRLAVVLLLLYVCPLPAERRIAVIVDTSGSMRWNDHSRFAVQISKILSDLVEDQDEIAIIRFPGPPSAAPVQGGFLDRLRAALAQEQQGAQNCDVSANPSLMVELRGSDRDSFKNHIDGLLRYDGPTYFGAPLRTAIPFLGEDHSNQRLLLLVSDAEEGFGTCKQQFTQMLQNFGSSGATVALIKIGGYADDGFANNPAIQFRQDVQDSAKLIGAVAQVYQRFLGSKKVQTGSVSGNITVEISPHVKDAYLVVAADSPLGRIQAVPGNPSVEKQDLDYRSGGQTKAVGPFQAPGGASGVDSQLRGYRIVHLVNPSPGSYTFSPPPGTTGGWMLLQDYALMLRLVSQTVPADSDAPLQLEVVDERTGTRITDGPTLNDLKIDGKIESSIVSLKNNGSGVFSVDHHFGQAGQIPAQIRLRGGSIDRTYNLSIAVSKNAPPLAPAPSPWQPPPAPTPASPPPPPPQPPPLLLTKPGELDFGQAISVNLGRLTAGGAVQSAIQFSNARISNAIDVEVSTDFNKRHAQIQIETNDGWQTLTASPIRIRIPQNDAMQWPLRVKVQNCPEACKPSESHKVSFVAHRVDGGEQRADVPIQIGIVPDPWYVCWRREIFALLALLAAGIIAHGFISPYRFARRAGVQMSPVEDLAEGYYFPLRAAAGSSAGFYRDASLYLTEDFRVTSNRHGGLVRLRAYRNQVRMRTEKGRSVWRQQADGSWEPSGSDQETLMRPGVLFRNDASTLYFEVRTK
jgi:hypothetical protein